jgi:peptide deformylase
MELKLIPEDSPMLLEPCQEFDFENPPHDPKELAESLYNCMIKNDGLGLSANQVGLPYRVFTMRSNPPLTLFNPRVVNASKNEILAKEGCLSYPLLYLNVKRPDQCRVRFQNENGETMTETFVGLIARVALHEYDHMEGKVFTQKASQFETQRAKRKRMILQRKVKKANK